MVKQTEYLLADFDNKKPNYAVLATGAVILLCSLAGVIWAIGSGTATAAVLFAIAAIGTILFVSLSYTSWKRSVAGDRNRRMNWDIDLPESQRIKLNREVMELARILEIPDEQMSDLLSAYIVAEDLALRQIQQEARVPLMRHVTVGNTPFDAVIIKGDLITCVEVTFLVTPIISKAKIDLILKKMAAPIRVIKNSKHAARIRLLLVLVTQLDESSEAELRSSMREKFDPQTLTVDVDIRLLDFEALQKIYAMD